HARDQELLAAFRDLSAAAKEVNEAIVEAEKGRGRPFSSEERAQELARFMEAGRALVARNDTRAERALERLKAGDESEAKRLFAEDAAAQKQVARQAVEMAAASAAEARRKAAKSLRNLAAIARPKNVAEAADAYKEATELDPADAQTWIDYAR